MGDNDLIWEDPVQLRLNLLVLYSLLGVAAAVTGLWLVVVPCILAIATVAPRVIEDHRMWSTWQQAEATLHDAPRQRAIYRRLIEDKHGLGT